MGKTDEKTAIKLRVEQRGGHPMKLKAKGTQYLKRNYMYATKFIINIAMGFDCSKQLSSIFCQCVYTKRDVCSERREL